MVLRMARATKRPECGVYQFRKRVPADVIALAGGPKEIKVSLRTKDEADARRLFRKVEAEHEARWAQVRLGLQDLDDRQVAALAGEVYRRAVGKDGDIRDARVRQSWSTLMARCEEFDRDEYGMTVPHVLWELDQLHGAGIREVLDRRGTRLTEDALERLMLAVHREMKRAADVVHRQARGDWSPDANLRRFPGLEVVSPPDPDQQFEAVWAAWLNESLPSANTVRRWRPALARMVDAFGTTDLSKVTDKMVVKWTDDLLQGSHGRKKLHNNTVARVHLAAAKAIFAFAKRKLKIPFDPTVDVTVDSGAAFETDMRGFDPHETATILRATMLPPSRKVSPALADARRWVPWICAYTGARVNEVTQARACDFSVHKGLMVLHVMAEAGTAKTGDRKVPLHPDLIDQGFGTFLKTKDGEEPLFYVPRKKRTAKVPAYEEMGARLSKWVRKLGISDRHLDPNHAWRHRFKGYSALQGHAPNTQARKYGEVDLDERVAAVLKLPRIEVTPLEPSTHLMK